VKIHEELDVITKHSPNEKKLDVNEKHRERQTEG